MSKLVPITIAAPNTTRTRPIQDGRVRVDGSRSYLTCDSIQKSFSSARSVS